MKIERLTQLLREEYPRAEAWVPEKSGKRQGHQVNVQFFENAKIYTYNDTILNVALRLGLIPEVNIDEEAKAALARLQSGGVAIAHAEVVDTIRHLAYPLLIGEANGGQDEFARKLIRVFVIESDPWIVR